MIKRLNNSHIQESCSLIFAESVWCRCFAFPKYRGMIGFGITSLFRTTLQIAVPQLIYKIKGIAEVNATKYTKAVKFCGLYLNINRIKVKIDLKISFSSWILFIYSKLFRRTWTEQRQDRRISWQKDGGNIGEGRSQFWLR